MKLRQDVVLFMNLCFRIFLILIVVKEESLKKPPEVKPIRHWLDPISNRVFLILVNGLNSEFLRANSTPYLQSMLDNYGSFGVSMTSYLETNEGGLKTILAGVSGYSSPVFWTRPSGFETLLEYVNCKCLLGSRPPDVYIPCYYPDEYPLENFSKLPHLFDVNNKKSCLYVINFDFDPVLDSSYGSRLKKLDDDIKFMATTVGEFWNNERTTFIVTSARGSPVGKSLSQNAPLLAWGSGIANTSEPVIMRPIDLTSVLCILLGSLFPTGMRGVFPMHVMDLKDYHLFEMASYTIRHFETVVKISDLKEFLMDSSELQLEQLITRLYHIVVGLSRAKFLKWLSLSIWIILITLIWGLNLLVLSITGGCHVSLSSKSLLSLIAVVVTTLVYHPPQMVNLISLEVLVWWTFQNLVHINFVRNCYQWILSVTGAIVVIVLANMFGVNVALAVFFLPVIFWCFFDCSYRKLNLFVLFTRVSSGIALCFLPLSRTFGVLPDFFSLSLITFLFLFNLFLVFNSFGQKIDFHTKINILMAIVARFYVDYLYRNKSMPFEGVFSTFLLVFTGLSIWLASGSMLVRLFKIFLALFIPVQMFSLEIESIFYFCIVYHMFTWVFVEYQSWAQAEIRQHPSVFSLEADKLPKTIQGSENNNRHLFFFVVYCHLSYFAMGHYPDLHSYDLYVLPAFTYPFTYVVSYSLGVIKFFIPFFVTTASLVTLRSVQGREIESFIPSFLWLIDAAGCCFIFSSQIIYKVFQNDLIQAKYSYFIIEQFMSISVVLSYFLSKYLLLTPKRFSWNFFSWRNDYGQEEMIRVPDD